MNERPYQRRVADINLYSAGPPLQILGAMEARETFPAKRHVLLLRTAGEHRAEHNQQVNRLISLGEWDEILSWPPRNKNRVFLHSNTRKFCRGLQKRLRENSLRLLIGGFNQYSSHLLRSILDPVNTIMLDDGTATLHHFENYLSNNQFHPDWAEHFNPRKGLINKLRAIRSGINFAKLQEPLDVFTCFDIEKPKHCQSRIFSHSFRNLAGLGRLRKQCRQTAFYFGSPLSEYGIVSKETEYSFIKKIFEYYSSKDIQATYIAHRDDGSSKIDSLEHAGLATRSLGMPAEVYFATASEVPAILASSLSTALHNVSKICPDLKTEAFPIPERYFLRKAQAACTVLEHFRSNGIQIINVDVEAKSAFG